MPPATGHHGPVTSHLVEVVNGKAVYDGRPLAAWVPDVVRRIAERCSPVDVILFGSVARGDDGADSDIDLLVVLPKMNRRHDAAVAVLRELRDFPVPIDVTVADPATMERDRHLPGVIRVALREGTHVLAAA